MKKTEKTEPKVPTPAKDAPTPEWVAWRMATWPLPKGLDPVAHNVVW